MRLSLLFLASLAACSENPSSGPNTPALGYLDFLAKTAASAKSSVIPGQGDDLLFVKELRSLGVGAFYGDKAQRASKATKPERRDPMPAILDFHAQMKAAGIQWLFVPVPAKVAVDPSLVPGAPSVSGRVDEYHQAFYALLEHEGVPVLDPTDALRALVADGKRAHCETDTHWSGDACVRVADLVAEKVGPRTWLKDAQRDYETERRDVSFVGDLTAMQKGESKETMSLTFVRDQSGKIAEPDASSPVLLMGDSHCLVFHKGGDMHAKGAGFAEHLMRALHAPVEVVGVKGSGATPSRLSVRRGKKLAGKKLVIWCLTVREFTESTQGWAKVPMM